MMETDNFAPVHSILAAAKSLVEIKGELRQKDRFKEGWDSKKLVDANKHLAIKNKQRTVAKLSEKQLVPTNVTRGIVRPVSAVSIPSPDARAKTSAQMRWAKLQKAVLVPTDPDRVDFPSLKITTGVRQARTLQRAAAAAAAPAPGSLGPAATWGGGSADFVDTVMPRRAMPHEGPPEPAVARRTKHKAWPHDPKPISDRGDWVVAGGPQTAVETRRPAPQTADRLFHQLNLPDDRPAWDDRHHTARGPEREGVPSDARLVQTARELWRADDWREAQAAAAAAAGVGGGGGGGGGPASPPTPIAGYNDGARASLATAPAPDPERAAAAAGTPGSLLLDVGELADVPGELGGYESYGSAASAGSHRSLRSGQRTVDSAASRPSYAHRGEGYGWSQEEGSGGGGGGPASPHSWHAPGRPQPPRQPSQQTHATHTGAALGWRSGAEDPPPAGGRPSGMNSTWGQSEFRDSGAAPRSPEEKEDLRNTLLMQRVSQRHIEAVLGEPVPHNHRARPSSSPPRSPATGGAPSSPAARRRPAGSAGPVHAAARPGAVGGRGEPPPPAAAAAAAAAAQPPSRPRGPSPTQLNASPRAQGRGRTLTAGSRASAAAPPPAAAAALPGALPGAPPGAALQTSASFSPLRNRQYTEAPAAPGLRKQASWHAGDGGGAGGGAGAPLSPSPPVRGDQFNASWTAGGPAPPGARPGSPGRLAPLGGGGGGGGGGGVGGAGGPPPLTPATRDFEAWRREVATPFEQAMANRAAASAERLDLVNRNLLPLRPPAGGAAGGGGGGGGARRRKKRGGGRRRAAGHKLRLRVDAAMLNNPAAAAAGGLPRLGAPGGDAAARAAAVVQPGGPQRGGGGGGAFPELVPLPVLEAKEFGLSPKEQLELRQLRLTGKSRVKFSYLYGSQNPHNIPVTARKAAKRNKSAARQAQRRASEARYWAGRELEYRHRRQAVVLVQAAWRGHLTRRLIFPWLHLRWTALTAIQAAWRGHVARRRAARLRWLRARHWGAVTIQRVFRGMRARQALADQRRLEALRRQQESPAVVLVAKETRALLSAHVEDLDAPAVALQCAWRGFLARDDALARWWGLHVLQRAWRCHAARRALGAARAERAGREAAALRLQGLARQRSARGEAAARRARREAAVRLQCAQRGRSARGEAAARRARREAAVALQCAQRGRAARGEAAARRARRAAEAAAVGRLQRCERGRRARARLARRHAAAARLQCLARRRAAARELRRRRGARAVAERAARRRAAAVALQCAWRGAAARWRAGQRRRERALRAAKARLRGEREAAATAIQAAWRGHRARARLQAAVRAARERAARELAAGRLQAAERGRQGRRRAAQRRRQRERHTRRQEAAVALQCAHRGRAARGEAAARRARREAEAAAATAIQAQHRRRAAAAAAGARRAEARRAAAATRIQAAQRQRAAAAAVGARRRQRDEGRAATAIQAAARARAARGEAAKRRSMAGHELRAYQARRAAERIAEERGRIAAATRLQARHRGNAARAEVALMRWSNAERRAALAIQCAVRQRQARARAGARREARARAAAALALQCAQRARAARAAAGARRARRRREERERAAAAAVQAAWRGHRARRRRRALEHRTIRLAQRYTRDLRRLAREDGATRLQALWRGHRVRRLGRLRRLRRLAREGAAATRITAAARGRVVRNGRPLDRQRRAQAARAQARREEGAATAIQAAQRGRAARGEAAARRRRAREEEARRRAQEEAAAATAIAAAARGRLARRALPGRRARAAERAAARQHALRRQASGAKLQVRRQERLGERVRRDHLARAVQRGWRAHWARRGPDVYAARAEAARRAQQEEQRERTRGRLAHRKAERLRRQHSAARIQRGYRAHAARQGAVAAEEEALARAMAAQWVLVEFGERGVRDSLVSLRARDQAAAELAAAKAAEVEAAARAEDLVEAACARAASRQKEREVVKEELLREKTRSFNIFGLNVDMPLFRDPSVLSLDTIVNGTEVLVDFLSSGDYRPATILRQHHDGSYDVIYHHGAKEVRVPKRRVAEMEPEIDYLTAEPVQDQRMQSCLTQNAASRLTYSQASSSTDLLSELHYPPCHTRNGSLQLPRPGEDPSFPPPLGPAPAHMAAPASRLPPVAPLAAFPEEKKYRCAMSTARHTRLLVAVVERPAARVMEVRALAPAGAAPVAVRASLRPADFAAAGVPYDPFAPGAGRESKLDACHLALLHREMAELALDWAGALAVGGRRFFCRVRERPGAEEFRVKYCDATAERAGELALPYAEVRARGCRGDPLLLPREDKLRACHTWLCEALLMGKLAALRGRLSEEVSLAGGDAQADEDEDEDGDGEGKGAEAEELRQEAAAAAAAGPLPTREARGDRWPTDLSSVTGQDLQAAGGAAERLEALGLLYAAAAPRGGGPRDLSAFPPAALAQLKRALPEVGATGDLLALPVPGRGEGAPPLPMRLVRAGERLALAPGDEAVYVPFEPWRGPGQQVELAGPGGQTLRLVYDEVMDEVRLDGASAGVGVGDEVELFPGLWCEVHRGSFIFRFIAGPLRAAAVGAKEAPAAAAAGEEPAAPLSPVEEEGEDPEAPPGDALRSTAKRRPSGGEAPGPGPAKKRQTTDLSGAAFDSAGAVQGRADAAAGQEDATLAPSLTDEFDQMSLVPEDEMAMILGKAFGKADDGAALEDQPFFTVEAAGVGDEAALPPPVPSAPGLEVLPKTNLMPTREKQEDESTVASALPGPDLAQREKFESRRILRCGSSSKSLVSPKIKREPQRDLNSSSPPPPSSTGCGEGGNQSGEAVAVPAAAMKERCSPDEGATRLRRESAATTRINAAARGHVVRSGRPLEARAQARREVGAATTIQTAQRARTAREEAAARRHQAQEEAAAATRINAAARGHVVRSGRPLEARAQARREASAATTIQTAQRARTAREEAAARRQQAQEEAARLRAGREAAEALARAMAAQWLRVQFGEHCVRNSLVSLLAGDQAAAELAAAREAEAEAAARAEELVESACVWAHVRRQEGAATTIQAAQRGRIARGEAAARRRWAQEEASRQRAGRAAAEALAGAVAAQWLRAQLGEHCARVGLTSLWAGERAAAELAAARAAEAAAAARAEELVEAACAWAASRQTERQVASEALVRTVTRSFKILGEDVEISLLRDASQSSLGSTSTKTEVNNGAVAGTSLLECEPLSVSADYAIAGTAHTVCGASVLECEKVAHSRATSIAAAAGVSLLECEPLSVSADYAIAGTAHTVSGASLLECGKVAHDQATSIVAVAGVSLLECEPLPASANHAIMHQETSLLLAFDVEEVSEGDQAAAIVAAEEQCSQPEVSEPETLMKAGLPPSQPLTHDSNLAVTHASHITSGVSNMQCAEVTASRPSHTPDMGPLLVSGDHAITHTSHIVAGVERLVCASIFQKDCDQASSGEAAASFEVEEPDQGDQSAILPSETEVVLEPKLAKLLDARAYQAATDVVTQAELLDAEASKAAMNVVAQNRANVPAAPVTWPATAGVSRLGCPSLMPLNGSADEISSMSNTVDFAQMAMLEAKAKKGSSKIKGGDFVPPRWAAAPCPEAGEVRLVVAGRKGGGGGAVVALTPLLRAAGGGPVFVGRARQHSAVVVKHASVGRRHAALVSGPTGQVFLRDLGDAAGGAPRTRVNGRPAAGLRPLRDGDRVELGAAPGRCTVEAAPPAPLPAAPRGPVGALAHLGGGVARPAARLAPLKTTKQQRQEELKLWSFLEDLEPRGAPAALASSDGGSVASMQKCSSQIGDIMASYDTLLEDQQLEGETAHLLRSMDWEAERQGHLDRALGALAEAVGGKKEQAKHRLGALRAFMKGASRRGSLARKAQRRAAQHTHAAQPARAVFPLAEVSPVVCRVAPQGPVGALAHAASAVAARRLDVRVVPATGSWSPQRDAEAAAQVEARLAQRVAWEAERAAGLEGAMRRFEAGLSAKTERAGLKLHAMNLFLHHGPALPAAAAAAPVGPPKDVGSLPSTAADSSLGGARPERPALGAAAAAAGPAGGGGGGGGAAALRAEQERLWRLEARLRYLEGALREGARAAAARLGAAQAFLEAARAEVAERRAAAVARAPLLPPVGEEGAGAAEEEEEERAKDAAVAEAFRLGRALEALGAEGRLAAALGARLGQLDRGLGVKLARCGARVQSLRRLRAALEAAALPSEEGGGGGRGGRRGRRGALGDYARDAAAAGGGAGRVSRMPSNASALSGAGGGDALSVVSELTTPAALAADDASVVTQQGEGLAAELGAEKARLGALAAKVAEYLLALQTRVRRDPVAANTAAARAFLASAGPRPAAAAAAGLASFGPQHRVAGAVAVAAPPLAPVPRGGGGGGQAAAAGGGGPGEGAAAVGDRAAWLGARLATLEEEMAPGLVGAGRVLRRAEACLEGSRVELVQRQAVAAFGGGSGGGGLEGRATARLVEEERWRLAELQRMLARFKAQVREKHGKAAAKLAALREINAALRAADELKDDASAASLASQAASVAAASRLTQDAMHTVALLEAERARCAALEERVARFERTLRAKLEGAAVPLAAVAAFARPDAADEGGDPEAQAAALNGEAEASLASAGRRLSAASHLLGDASLELERRRLPGGGGGADAAGREHEEYLRGVLAEERERVAALGRMMAQVEASLAEKRERARAKLAAVRQLRWKGGGEGEGEGGAQEGRRQGQGQGEGEGASCRRPSEGTVRTLALLEAEQERAADLEARVAAFEEAMQARLQGTTVKLAAVAAFSAARAEEAASSSAAAKAKAAAAAAGGDARSPAERRLERASGRVAARLARAARRLSAASRHLDQAEAANSGGGGDAASSLGGGGGGSGGSGGGSEGGQSDEGARSRATAELVAAQRAKAAELEAMMARLEAAVAEKRGRARAKLAAAAALGAKGARAGGAAAAALPAEEGGGAPLAEERERAAALEVRATVFEKVVKAKVKISAMTSAGENILE